MAPDEILTARICPSATSRYTVALQTRSRSATSRMVRSRAVPRVRCAWIVPDAAGPGRWSRSVSDRRLLPPPAVLLLLLNLAFVVHACRPPGTARIPAPLPAISLHARGRSLTVRAAAHERSESARVAALARWGRLHPANLPRETHGGTLRLPVGDGSETIQLDCAVLDGKYRVISTRGLGRSMGSRKTGTDETGSIAPKLPPFLAAQNLFPFISETLRMRVISPTVYKPKVGSIGYGYDAELLPKICGVILEAKKAGVLKRSQEYLVERADAPARAKVGAGEVRRRGARGPLPAWQILQVCKSANIITGSLHKILKEKLDRRNVAAHPSQVVVSQLTAEDFIKDVVENVVLSLK
jgi:hypothetical protein